MTSEVGAAVERLVAALGQLETALERRLGEARRGDLETELQLMQDDRARLALELESTSSRLNRVETAADHIGRRVGTAIGVIESLLAGHEPAARDGAV
jgi:hypothetical protein